MKCQERRGGRWGHTLCPQNKLLHVMMDGYRVWSMGIGKTHLLINTVARAVACLGLGKEKKNNYFMVTIMRKEPLNKHPVLSFAFFHVCCYGVYTSVSVVF